MLARLRILRRVGKSSRAKRVETLKRNSSPPDAAPETHLFRVSGAVSGGLGETVESQWPDLNTAVKQFRGHARRFSDMAFINNRRCTQNLLQSPPARSRGLLVTGNANDSQTAATKTTYAQAAAKKAEKAAGTKAPTVKVSIPKKM